MFIPIYRVSLFLHHLMQQVSGHVLQPCGHLRNPQSQVREGALG